MAHVALPHVSKLRPVWRMLDGHDSDRNVIFLNLYFHRAQWRLVPGVVPGDI